MPTIVSGSIPASEFALSYTMELSPESRFEIERVVTSGDESVMPLLWARGGSRADLEETLAADPTVGGLDLVCDLENEWLFRIEWDSHVDLVLELITSSSATVMGMVGRDGQWKLRVLYPQRSTFSRLREFGENHGLDFEVESIRELDGESSGRYDLTAEQYEVLSVAQRRGYFAVPRGVTLETLAEDLGITHQAASERLRRATEALVDTTLHVEQCDGSLGERPDGSLERQTT